MKNIERFIDEIINMIEINKICDFLKKHEIISCSSEKCNYCYPGYHYPRYVLKDFLEKEGYTEPEIDWTKVPVDTNVIYDPKAIYEESDNLFSNGHYAGFIDGYPSVFPDGLTSWSIKNRKQPLSYANISTDRIKLANKEDIEKYRKM